MNEIPEGSEICDTLSFKKFLDFNYLRELSASKGEKLLFSLININYSREADFQNKNSSNEEKFLHVVLNKKLIKYAMNSNGRLDIYAKAHIVNRLFNALDLKFPQIKNSITNLEILADFTTMEKDLLNILALGENEKFTQKKFDSLIEKFVDDMVARNFDMKIIKELKKMLVLYQNINDQESIKLMESLLVKLMGHPEVIRLNSLYAMIF